MTALVHSPTALADADLAEAVLGAVRFVVEKERLRGQIEATSTDAAALPTGFVTLLMTDIEGSTALLRKLGDRYGALLNDVRGADPRGGVAGQRPRDRCARRRVLCGLRAPGRRAGGGGGHPARPRPPPVARRSGRPGARRDSQRAPHADRCRLHRAGRCTPRPGSATAAHGGQILVSAATRAAIGDRGPAGLRFRSLGRHRLPGLPDTEMLLQALAQGLRSRFPPPRVGRGSIRRDRRVRPGDRKRGAGDQMELPQAPPRP